MPLMADLVHTTVKVHSGLSLHVVRGGVRGGITLLLLPAYADSWWSYSRVLPGLAEELDVLAVDLRGHGDSDRPACCYRVEDFAGDIVALLDALDIDAAALVGHSGSCFVARRVAVQHPSRVAALALLASPLALERASLEEFIEAVRSLQDPIGVDFIRDFQLGAAHLAIPEDFLEGIVAESAKVPARVWRDTLDGLLDFRDERDLGAIKAPTTLIWGDHDTIVARGDQERLQAAIPDSKLIVMADTGHSLHWERPDATVDVLLAIAERAG